MKIEQLSENSYRVRKMYKGKTYRVIFDHRPTQKEISITIADKLQEDCHGELGSFENCAAEYIENRRNVCSPATIRTYNRKLKQISDVFKALRLSDITSENVQAEVNRLSKKLQPKTVKTTYGFIASVLGANRPNMKLRVKLPQTIKKTVYEPTNKDIKRILKKAKGTEYNIPFQLGVLGCRRGEICALSIDDLAGNNLTIHRTMVYDENNVWVIKETPKTDESNRILPLPQALAEDIREQGYIYNNHPNALNKAIHRYQKALKIPQFKFHALRSYFASYAHSIGIPDKDIMSLGGWATDSVMKRVYRKSIEESKSKSVEKITKGLLG